MAIKIERYDRSSNTGAFVENMRHLVDVVNNKLENVKGDRRRELLPLDRNNLRHRLHAYLLCQALRLVGEAGSVNMVELARGLQKKKYTCLRLVNWMSDRGLIKRNRDPKDRRAIRIWLTYEGYQLCEAMNEASLQEIDSV